MKLLVKMKINEKGFIAILLIIFLCAIGFIFDSTIACRIVTLILIVVCFVNGHAEKKMLNPFYLFALTPMSLMVYSNISSKYMVDLSVETWLLAIINMGAFICALIFGPGYKEKPTCYDVQENSKLGTHILLLSLFGFVPTYLHVFFYISLPLYSILPLFCGPAVICAFYSKNKKWIAMVLILTIIPWFVEVTKSNLLRLLITLLVLYESKNTLSIKNKTKVFLFSGVVLVIMIAAFTFANQSRGNRTAEDTLQYFATYSDLEWSAPAVLLAPYMYFTTPWANLQYVVQTQDTRTYGLWLLRPFINYLQLDHNFSYQYRLRSISSFNTFSFVATHFKDFGFLGSIFSSILIGLFVKWVYTRSETTKRPLDIACYASCAQAVSLMFFSNHFLQVCYPITMVLFVAIYRLVFCGRIVFGKK